MFYTVLYKVLLRPGPKDPGRGWIAMADRTYLAIDLKSFYASVECAERRLDPLNTNLVVADPSRTEKTICLAVSPSLKAYGISGRARLFEVVQRVKEINRDRLRQAVRRGAVHRGADGAFHFSSASFDASALASDPALELAFYIAPPRMKLYEEYSTRVYSIYLKYLAPEDILVYSVDEVFLDVTNYLKTYGMTAHRLAMTMIQEVLYATGITATAGIGTNLFLAKVAMDIVAKHVPADRDGVRIAELDEVSFRKKLWCHTPITDFWRVGPGIARRLEALDCRTMGDVARLSVLDEGPLYGAFGINAELLIDHAWGWEPVTLEWIRRYRPTATSLSSGQVLMKPYTREKGRLIVREMTDLLVMDLIRKGFVTKKLTLTIGYDRASLRPSGDGTYTEALTGKHYTGSVKKDHYGRPHPTHAHGTESLDRWTASTKRIMAAMTALYDRITDPGLLVRRVNVAAVDLIPEHRIPGAGPEQLSLFTDYEALARRQEAEKRADEKEKRLQRATLFLRGRYGKNAVLKGMNLEEGATTVLRNRQIGGHRSGEEGGAGP